jgi:hypothetical protein
MGSEWALDLIDTRRDMVKVRNTQTGTLRVFFVAFLTNAYVQNNTITCTCEKGGWTIEIISGNRKRIQPENVIAKPDSLQHGNVRAELLLPAFLKKP